MMTSTTLSSVLWKYFSPRSLWPQMYMRMPGTYSRHMRMTPSTPAAQDRNRL